jgi:hypothetical protein
VERKLGCCLALLMMLCTAPPRAQAQPTLAQVDELEAQRARDAFHAGKEAFERGEYETALDHFTSAERAVQSPNTELMIARCLARLGQLAPAYSAFSAVIRNARTWGDGRYEQSARAAGNEQLELKPRIAMLTVDVQDPTFSATLTVAGREVPRSDWAEPIAIDPGAFEVVLTGRSGAHDRHAMTLQAGVAATLALAIEPEPSAVHIEPPPSAPRAAVPDLVPQAARAPKELAGSGLRTWGYVVGAVGVAGIAAFAVFGTLSNAEFAQLDEACPERADCAAGLREGAERGRTYQTVANVALGLGAAALCTGVALWLLGGPDETTQVSLGPTGVRVRGAL